MERAAELISAARRLLGEGPRPGQVTDPRSARSALSAVWEATTAHLRSGVPASPEVVAVLRAVKEIDDELVRAELARRDRILARVGAALARLDEATSCTSLLDVSTTVACELGFDRALLSRVADALWIPERAEIPSDPQWGTAIVEMARDRPQGLDGSLLETEMIRRRTPLLVQHADERPGVNRPLLEACRTRSYCAAPWSCTTSSSGSSTPTTTTAARDQLAQLSTRLTAVHAGQDLGGVWGGATTPVDRRRENLAVMLRDTPADPSLTARESDIVRLMATGATNAGIARRLFISEGTVKGHVKAVLRKLGAANRAEAVSY